MGKYIAIIDERFAGISLKEFQESIGDFEVTAYPAHGQSVVLELESRIGEKEFYGRMSANEPVFLDFYMTFDALLKSHGMPAVLNALKKALRGSKGASFKLEAKLFDADMGRSSKDIEVELGGRLEKLGHYANLSDPDAIFYLIFIKGHAFIGHLDRKYARLHVLDRFRLENRNVPDTVSRAEFKLKEAVEFFGIDLSGVGSAIDIGAAPGGWSAYLAKNGIRVLAVDNAELDRTLLKNKNITHLKREIRTKRDLNRIDGKFEMLVMDANISPKEAVRVVNLASSLIKKGSPLVLTAKLLTDSISAEIDLVRAELSNRYRGIKMKRLPHNRREITVFAIRD